MATRRVFVASQIRAWIKGTAVRGNCVQGASVGMQTQTLVNKAVLRKLWFLTANVMFCKYEDKSMSGKLKIRFKGHVNMGLPIIGSIKVLMDLFGLATCEDIEQAYQERGLMAQSGDGTCHLQDPGSWTIGFLAQKSKGTPNPNAVFIVFFGLA